MTPYARSKQALEAVGYQVGRTEHWNSFIHRRQDLFNLFDMVAVRADQPGLLGVNPTTGDHVADHIAKALESPVLPAWLRAGLRYEIHGWRKVGARGKRKTWECRVIRFALALDGTIVTIYPGPSVEPEQAVAA